MRFFKDRFGFDEIKLTIQEKVELQQKLTHQDQQRTEFFAMISLVACLFFIVFDLSELYEQNQVNYLVFDLILFVVSLVIILAGNKKLKTSNSTIKIYLTYLYPIICIVWATVIATLQPLSMLNMFTFYIVIFLLTFFITSNVYLYISYFVTFILTYVISIGILHRPLLSETLYLLLLGGIITIPFYFSYRTTRKNSVSALVKINKSNQLLEYEVERKIKQLRLVNEDLSNEIAHRKIIEQKLREALKKAETSDKLKSEFLANISHEIRTPLNAIIGFTEMLTEDGVKHEQKVEFQKLVSSNTMFLLSTIDDIFDASLVNKQQINIINAPFVVNKFLDSVFYETAGVELKYDSPNIKFIPVKLPNDQFILVTDEYYLKKAMMRLIDNAFKFTHSGSVEVGAKMVKSKLQLYVKDTGISIREEDKEKIFEPFVQGDGSFTRDYGGAGLGLSIVKGIVNAIKCDFKMESKKGEGSTFFLLFNHSFFKVD